MSIRNRRNKNENYAFKLQQRTEQNRTNQNKTTVAFGDLNFYKCKMQGNSLTSSEHKWVDEALFTAKRLLQRRRIRMTTTLYKQNGKIVVEATTSVNAGGLPSSGKVNSTKDVLVLMEDALNKGLPPRFKVNLTKIKHKKAKRN